MIPELEALASIGIRRRYPAAALVFAEGDPAGAALVVLAGAVRVSTARGGDVGRCGVGELVGELSALDGLPRSATVTTIEPTLLAAVSGVRLAEAMARDLRLRGHVEAVLDRRRPPLDGHRGPPGQGLPVEALAGWILARGGGDGQPIHLSLADIAGIVGCSRELLSRSVDHLARTGAVELDHGRLLVRSTPVLRRLASTDATAPGSPA